MVKTIQENVPKVEIDGKAYPIKLTWKIAYTINDKYEYNILKLFIDTETTNQAIIRLHADTEFVVNLAWDLLGDRLTISKDQLLEIWSSPAEFEPFIEAFWAAVVNFSTPAVRKLLRDTWDQLRKELRNIKIDFETSMKSSSESPVEEST